jgi:carbon monoxide dehydrogenase subunit G
MTNNMEFDNSFDVPLSPAQAWAMLMDIRRIAPCMPGAALTEVIDAQNFRGKIAVRLGPVALAFAGRVQFEDVDEANHSAQVKAQGSDDKGRGSANATATFRIEPADIGSRVFIHTDLMLSGAVAQYGRGVGMIQATAAQIIGQFASNLRAQLERQPASATPDVQSPPIVPERTPTPPRAAQIPASARPSPQPDMPPPDMPPLPAAKPISGFTLLARVIWQQVRALFSGRKD